MEASAALICNQFIGAASFSFFTLKSLRFPSVPVLHSEYGAVRDETSSFPAETFKSKQEVPGSGTAPPGRSCTCRMDTHTLMQPLSTFARTARAHKHTQSDREADGGHSADRTVEVSRCFVWCCWPGSARLQLHWVCVCMRVWVKPSTQMESCHHHNLRFFLPSFTRSILLDEEMLFPETLEVFPVVFFSSFEWGLYVKFVMVKSISWH